MKRKKTKEKTEWKVVISTKITPETNQRIQEFCDKKKIKKSVYLRQILERKRNLFNNDENCSNMKKQDNKELIIELKKTHEIFIKEVKENINLLYAISEDTDEITTKEIINSIKDLENLLLNSQEEYQKLLKKIE